MPVTFNKETSEIEFSSGRRYYCHNGSISISPNGNIICYGYDGSLDDLENEDKLELADQMIAMWTRFKEKTEDEMRS